MNRFSIPLPTRILLVCILLSISIFGLFLVNLGSRSALGQSGGTCAQLRLAPNLDRFPLIAPTNSNEAWFADFFDGGDIGRELMANWPEHWQGRFIRVWDPEFYDPWPTFDKENWGDYSQITDIARVSRWEFDDSCAAIGNSVTLVAQAHDIRIYPGQTARIWFTVRNSGLATWSGTNGYQWIGVKKWRGLSGYLPDSIAPDDSYSFSMEITAPNTPGETHYYGLVLSQNGSKFGPIFFAKVHVIEPPKLLIDLNSEIRWAQQCDDLNSACMPIKLSLEDLPVQWQGEARSAAAVWSDVGTKLRFTISSQSDSERILVASYPNDCIRKADGTQEIKLAFGEIRILPMAMAPVTCTPPVSPIGVPYVDPTNPTRIIAGLILLPDASDMAPWLRYSFDGIEVLGEVDLRTIIAHELGHTLGFCHQAYPNCGEDDEPVSSDAVMRAAGWSNLMGVERKELQKDDLAWLTAKYGNLLAGAVGSTPELLGPSWLVPFDLGTPTVSLAASSANRSFTWTANPSSDHYVLQVSNSAAFETILYSTRLQENRLALSALNESSTVLEPFQRYFWRVQATNAYGNSDWSIPWEMRVTTQSCGIQFDANCDGQVNLADFEVWRQEYCRVAIGNTTDFNHDGGIDFQDYDLWHDAYSAARRTLSTADTLATQPASARLDRSFLSISDNQSVDVSVILETAPSAPLSAASIGIQYPTNLLNYLGATDCNLASTEGMGSATKATYTLTDEVNNGTIRLERTLTHEGEFLAGRFCLATLRFGQKSAFDDSVTGVISLDAQSSPWELVGPQTIFQPYLRDETAKLTLHKGPVLYLPAMVEGDGDGGDSLMPGPVTTHLIADCSPSTPNPTPTSTNTPAPTATPVPTRTKSPEPTTTPSPTPTATDISDIPISGLVVGHDGPTSFGDATNFWVTIESGNNVSISWNFGDGTFGSGFSVTHNYGTPGEYHVTVEASNSTSHETGATTVLVNPPDANAMVYIPAGAFKMGCDAANPAETCEDDELPLHEVYLDGYYIDKYEVSNSRYEACVDAGGCSAPYTTSSRTRSFYFGNAAYADYPVVNVTKGLASTFCAWEGKRLPTEAEWEKAARGNSDTRKFPWGDETPTCNYTNWGGEEGGCVGDTSAIGTYPTDTSPYGVRDMAGNVWEWVSDHYDADYYSVSPYYNPTGPADRIKYEIWRGGSWSPDSDLSGGRLRIANRGWDLSTVYGSTYGFRCASSP